MKKNVMLDLETLGNGSNAVIISIGAVEFDEDALGREFYTIVDPQSCVNVGMQIDASTVMWWMQQEVVAKEAFKSGGIPIASALNRFGSWFPAEACVWGNGATFDNVVLSNAYKACFMPRPWTYKDDRCYRTLRALFPEVVCKDYGVKHNALDDAKAQAIHCIELLKALKS